jgi:hypothetical protein
MPAGGHHLAVTKTAQANADGRGGPVHADYIDGAAEKGRIGAASFGRCPRARGWRRHTPIIRTPIPTSTKNLTVLHYFGKWLQFRHESQADIEGQSGPPMMGPRLPTRSGDEHDAITRWPAKHLDRAGVRARVKRRMRRRERQAGKVRL